MNEACDTSDLVRNVKRGTQYKNKHHDPQYEAKERAKIKVFAEIGVQAEIALPSIHEVDAVDAQSQPSSRKEEWADNNQEMSEEAAASLFRKASSKDRFGSKRTL